MSIQGSLHLFSPLDLLQSLSEKSGVLRLTTSSTTVEAWISSGYLTRLVWQRREQPLHLAPLVLLEVCSSSEGRFKFVSIPGASGVAGPKPLCSASPVRLSSLLRTLAQARIELEDGMKLPSGSEWFMVWKPAAALREWESALLAIVSPLLLQGYSVLKLAEGLQLPLEGLRYGLGCLQRAGSIETLVPAIEVNWMSKLVQAT